MPVVTRLAQANDAVHACAVIQRSIRESCVADHGQDSTIFEAWLRNKTADTVRQWFESPVGFSVVAESDGRLVGVGRVGQGNQVVLCYVAPDAQRRGVGRAVLAALEDEARARGFTELELGSTRTAHAFYLRHGYADTGAVETMFGLTAIRMRKTLAQVS